jgi:hypothetical protein
MRDNARNVVKLRKERDKSTEWLRDQVVKLAHGGLALKTARTSKIAIKDSDGPTNKLRLNSMYFFLYDPKHKKTLPYYDTFPLIIPFNYTEDGFYGLNLHYLPPYMRAALMDRIIGIMNKRGMTDEKKYRFTASMLNAIKNMPEFQPCVKRYLSAHVRSLFRPVPPEEWQYAVLLNSENFEKASKSTVWADSLRKIGASK